MTILGVGRRQASARFGRLRARVRRANSGVVLVIVVAAMLLATTVGSSGGPFASALAIAIALAVVALIGLHGRGPGSVLEAIDRQRESDP